MRHISRLIGSAFLIGLLNAPAQAASALSQDTTYDIADGGDGPAEVFSGLALSDAGLQAIAGREDISQTATSQHVAEVSQNSVGDNVRTGDVQIADNAFQNLSGISLLNVNSGNNVAINASLNVNISLSPLP